MSVTGEFDKNSAFYDETLISISVNPYQAGKRGHTWLTSTTAKLVGSVLTLSQVNGNALPDDWTVDVLGELTRMAWTEASAVSARVSRVVGNMAGGVTICVVTVERARTRTGTGTIYSGMPLRGCVRVSQKQVNNGRRVGRGAPGGNGACRVVSFGGGGGEVEAESRRQGGSDGGACLAKRGRQIGRICRRV